MDEKRHLLHAYERLLERQRTRLKESGRESDPLAVADELTTVRRIQELRADLAKEPPMEVTDRIPRALIRDELRHLKPGEQTWLPRHDFHVTENGRVLVELSAMVWVIEYDSWIREPQKNNFCLERTETGWRLHILSRDTIIADRTTTHEKLGEGGKWVRVEEIIIHADEDEVCPTCQGAGITNLNGKGEQSPGVPFVVLKRLKEIIEKDEDGAIELERWRTWAKNKDTNNIMPDILPSPLVGVSPAEPREFTDDELRKGVDGLLGSPFR